MATIIPNKTPAVEIIAHQAVTHPVTVVGSAVSVLTKRSVVVFFFHGYVEATADTNPGKFLMQVRPDAGAGAVTEHWTTIDEIYAAGTTPDTEAMTATEPVGETVLAVASTTGFIVDDPNGRYLYIQDANVVADGEWAMLKTIVTNTNIQLIDGLTVQKDSADFIWNDCKVSARQYNLEALETFRVVWTHEGAVGANGHIKVLASYYNSDTSS